MARTLAAAAVFLLCGCGSSMVPAPPPPPPPPAGPIALKPLVAGLSQPLDIEQPADGSNRFFIVEQGGTIHILENGQLVAQPFLDISSKVTDSVEMGLLGVAFHPGFPQDKRFYVNYVRTVAGQIQSVIAEYQVSTTNADFSDSRQRAHPAGGESDRQFQ